MRTGRFITSIAAASALALLATGASAATFVGDIARFSYSGAGIGTPVDVRETIVDPGWEAHRRGGAFADMGAMTLTISYDLRRFVSVGTTTQWTVSELDASTGRNIVGFALTSGTAALVSGTSFTQNSVSASFVDIQTATHGAMNTFTFAITVAPVSTPIPMPMPVPVPLPTGLVLLGAGIGGLVLLGRRAA